MHELYRRATRLQDTVERVEDPRRYRLAAAMSLDRGEDPIPETAGLIEQEPRSRR